MIAVNLAVSIERVATVLNSSGVRGGRRTPVEPEEPIAVRMDAPLALADLLRVPPGEPLYTYDALQTAEPGLRQLHRTYVPFSILISTKYEDEAPPPAPRLYAAVADLGHELHFTEYLRPRMPLPDQAQALRLPVLTILRVTLNEHDKPLALESSNSPATTSNSPTLSEARGSWLKLSLRLQAPRRWRGEGGEKGAGHSLGWDRRGARSSRAFGPA
ncbi:UTRA domain-containing protein [Streptomyces sp. NBC_01477]|uniref:UTRA domain-containing protein n=1 Tax=Streptomyces sp. NBC_01477 TaxID=2976015 RepID=UPI002E3083FB|nr:UTRA domain-containing protein [Streptomyces sp. NBC_01477]